MSLYALLAVSPTLLVAMQMVALLIAIIARLTPCRCCHAAFFGCLAFVAVLAVASAVLTPAVQLLPLATLAAMVLAAVVDFESAGAAA